MNGAKVNKLIENAIAARMKEEMELIQSKREKIEMILLKNFDPKVLSDEQIIELKVLSKEFTDRGKTGWDLLIGMHESESFDKELFFIELGQITDITFMDGVMKSETMVNIYPQVEKYEECIKINNQYNFALFLSEAVKNDRVINLNADLMEEFTYKQITKSYKTFAESEKETDRKEHLKFATHVEFLDTAFNGGIEIGQLVLVSGDYEAGKTTLCTQILENISFEHKVCFFCFEFTTDSYIQRRQKQPSVRLNKDNMIIINDGYDIQDIKNNIEILHQTQGIRVFLIDSQMRIENALRKNGSGEEKESEKFELLGKLAHRLGLIIFLIIQTSKADEDTPFKSKKGAHEASIIMHLAHKDESKKDIQNPHLHKRLLKVKKNKQTGKHFKEDILFNDKTGFFEKDPAYRFPNSSKRKKYDENGDEVIEGSAINIRGFSPDHQIKKTPGRGKKIGNINIESTINLDDVDLMNGDV